METTNRMIRALVALLAVALLGACSGGDDDAGGDTTGAGGEAKTEALDEDEARQAGNDETFDRIAALEDCLEVYEEKVAAEANAERRGETDPRRASILETYADAADERMDELDCDDDEVEQQYEQEREERDKAKDAPGEGEAS